MTAWADEIPPQCTGAQMPFNLLRETGGLVYLGESVSVLEHSVQTATLARAANATPSMIGAALLHDIGHLLHDHGRPAITSDAEEFAHEEIAAGWLSATFGPEVCEPIRLHVLAKRYLCAVEPAYLTALSSASLHSLVAQGGILTFVEVELFEHRPYAEDAVSLRRWDDAAKDPEAEVPGLSSYQTLLSDLASRAVG